MVNFNTRIKRQKLCFIIRTFLLSVMLISVQRKLRNKRTEVHTQKKVRRNSIQRYFERLELGRKAIERARLLKFYFIIKTRHVNQFQQYLLMCQEIKILKVLLPYFFDNSDKRLLSNSPRIREWRIQVRESKIKPGFFTSK